MIRRAAPETVVHCYDIAPDLGLRLTDRQARLSVAQIQTEHPAKPEGNTPKDQNRQHKDRGHLGRCAQCRPPADLLALIVMPLDGKEHARTQRDNLERRKDDRHPIHIKDFHLHQPCAFYGLIPAKRILPVLQC